MEQGDFFHRSGTFDFDSDMLSNLMLGVGGLWLISECKCNFYSIKYRNKFSGRINKWHNDICDLPYNSSTYTHIRKQPT